MSAAPITPWPAKVRALMETVNNLFNELQALARVPQGPGDASQRLAWLLEARRATGAALTNHHLDPGWLAGERVRDGLERSAGAAGEAMKRLVRQIDAEIGRELGAGGRHESLLFTRDFTALAAIPQTGPNGQPVRYVVGLIDVLPEAHPARKLMPREDYYETGRGPGLVLGLASGDPPVTPLATAAYYDTGAAVALTRVFRGQQVQRELERRTEEERRREEAEERWRVSPAGREAAMRRELEALRREVTDLKSKQS